ncbi:MAG: glycosyltransferase family 4 protein [Rhodothermales bacterium]|nr:glycosyltransferase family 4 protein [Rhodothermales bacterium]
MKVCIVFPVFPPSIDGIGDYTSRIAEALGTQAEVHVLTGPKPHATIAGVRVETTFDQDPRLSGEMLVAAVDRIQPDWVLVQYNPFSYGKWGYNPHLPRSIRQIAEAPGRKVALMIHEPYVPPENLRFHVMRLWQLRQFNSLINSAALVFFSISAWTEEFRLKYPDKRIVHLPIGSNIPLVPGNRSHVRSTYGISDDTILLGLFGSGHPNRLFNYIHASIKQLRDDGVEAPLLYVGGSAEKLQAAMAGATFIDGGKLPADDVSRHLSAMDIYLCPFGKGVSSRRGSFMAGIQHGLPCVTTTGSQTDSFFKNYDGEAFIASPDSSIEDFCQNVRRVIEDVTLRHRLAEGGRRLYTERFKWETIATRAMNAMAGQE